MHDELLCIASCRTFVIDAFFYDFVLWADLEFLKSLFELVKKLMQSRKKNNLLGTFADSSKCTLMPKIQFELCLSEISFDCKPFFKKPQPLQVCVVFKLKKSFFRCPTFKGWVKTQNVILGTAWNWKSMSPRLSPYILSFFNS